jgi:hypothetical protein
LLETEHVIFPKGTKGLKGVVTDERLEWPIESLAFAETRKSAPVKSTPGYRVSPDDEDKIESCLAEFGIVGDITVQAIMPYSNDINSALSGKRLATHPLHDTYLRRDDEDVWNSIAESNDKGSLIAVRSPQNTFQTIMFDIETNDAVPAMQVAYSTPWKKLLKRWSAEDLPGN